MATGSPRCESRSRAPLGPGIGQRHDAQVEAGVKRPGHPGGHHGDAENQGDKHEHSDFTTHASGPRRIRRRGHGVPRIRARLRQAGPHRAAHQRRLRRGCHRACGFDRARQGLRPAGGDREPAGCRWHHRGLGRGQGSARWIDAGHGVQQPRDQSERLQEDAFRRDQRHHADQRDRRHAAGAGGEPQGAGEERQGAGGAGQGQARHLQLRIVRQRHHHSPGRRNVHGRSRRSRRDTSPTRAPVRW